jgi:transposase
MDRRVVKRYSEAFKRQVVSEYDRGTSSRALQRKYGIGGKQTVERWVRQYSSAGLHQEIAVVSWPEGQESEQKLLATLRELDGIIAHLTLEKIILEASLAEAEKWLGIDLKKEARTAIIERCYEHPQRQAYGIRKQAILQRFGISRQAHQQQLHKLRRQEEKNVTLELMRAIGYPHPHSGTHKSFVKR